jgi:hypothetical protein
MRRSNSAKCLAFGLVGEASFGFMRNFDSHQTAPVFQVTVQADFCQCSLSDTTLARRFAPISFRLAVILCFQLRTDIATL